MGLTGITLGFGVSGLLRKRCSRRLQKTELDPHRQNDREGCDFYCWNEGTRSYDQYFFTDGVECFYNNGDKGLCQNGECHLTTDTRVPSKP
uniref:Putative grp-2 463 glycine rich family n=1 Tax=Ixodes ricinus TaxID=34613 RepID=V5I5J6_IXORI